MPPVNSSSTDSIGTQILASFKFPHKPSQPAVKLRETPVDGGIMDPANGAQVSGSFLTPLLISLAGVVATFLALIVYHWLLIKYCLRHRDQADDLAVSAGVEHKILETIPILSFTRENVKELGTDQTECVICLGELKEGETVCWLPNCRHLFHVPCIDNWFSAHSCCPICRTLVAVTADVEGEKIRDVARNVGHDGDRAALTSGVQSNVLLRHCVSLVFPRENKSQQLTTWLKRSLSMDQFHMYLIDDTDSGESSSSTWNMILTNSDSCKVHSKRQLDQMSPSLLSLRPFSELQIGRRSSSYGILPY